MPKANGPFIYIECTCSVSGNCVSLATIDNTWCQQIKWGKLGLISDKTAQQAARKGRRVVRVHWQRLQSVWQAPEPSLGQNRVSAFFLPSWSCWGSGSSARHVYLNLCSCLDPSWLTLTGIQGVQGVLRRTSGQASKLQALYSCKIEENQMRRRK